MKIARIQGYVVQGRIETPFSASIARGRHTHRSALLVRVITDTGAEGWGETFQALSGPVSPLVATLRDVVGPAALGQPVHGTQTLWAQARRRTRGYGPLALRAHSALDTALWDAAGRERGLPVCALLGAAEPGAFPAVATAIFYGDPPEALDVRLEAVRAQLAAGFRAIKLKIGGVAPEVDIEHVARIREALPAQTMLAVDANAGLTPTTALRLARALEPLGVHWLEEPFPVEDVEGYARLAAATSLVLAGGQDLPDAEAFAPHLRRGSLHLVQPSVAAAGGITGCHRVALAASALGARYCPTGWGTGLLIAASLHLRAAHASTPALPPPDRDWVEFDVSPNPLRDALLATPIAPEDGLLAVPAGPGLGVSVDEAALEHFTTETFEVTA